MRAVSARAAVGWSPTHPHRRLLYEAAGASPREALNGTLAGWVKFSPLGVAVGLVEVSLRMRPMPVSLDRLRERGCEGAI